MLFRWLLAMGGFALLLFCFSPAWGAFRIWARVPEMGGLLEVRRGGSVLWQIDHLGAEIPDKLHGAIQWRLLFPLIGRLLALPPWACFALADAGCVVVLAFIVTVLRRRELGFFETGLAATVDWYRGNLDWMRRVKSGEYQAFYEQNYGNREAGVRG